VGGGIESTNQLNKPGSGGARTCGKSAVCVQDALLFRCVSILSISAPYELPWLSGTCSSGRSKGQGWVPIREQSFDCEQINWPDFRNHEFMGIAKGTKLCAVAWCHGSAGIGLSRLRAHRLLGDPSLLHDAQQAFATCKDCDNLKVDSTTHGDEATATSQARLLTNFNLTHRKQHHEHFYQSCSHRSCFALTAAIAGPAAANVSTQAINAEVRSSFTGGNVNVVVNDGVATLFGWVEDHQAEQAAKQAALSFDGVDSIVDRITVSR